MPVRRITAYRAAILALCFLILSPAHGQEPSAAGSVQPITVSPGNATTAARIADGTPTFLWGAVAGAQLYQLVVFRVPDGSTAEELTPVLELELPGSALGFTPSLDRGLERGKTYGWMLRAHTEQGATQWSEPALFRVTEMPSALEVRQALEILRAYAGVAAVHETTDEPDSGPGHTDPLPNYESPMRGAPAHALVATPDLTALKAELADTTGIIFGVHGLSKSTGDGSAAVVGESTAASGNVFGVQGQSASAAGAAGVFDNTAGGDILRGLVNATEVFTVEGSGNVVATSFSGDGSSLTNLSADTATQLATDGTNCPAGEAALGVDQLGNTQSCYDVATQVELDNVVLVNDGAFVNVAGDTMTGDLDLGGNALLQGVTLCSTRPAPITPPSASVRSV